MASTYLYRGSGESASNRRTWTWSGWIKRCKISDQQIITACSYDSSNRGYLYFTNGDAIGWTEDGGSVDIYTTRKFKDTNAWYHIVLANDTTQATASNRMKLYVNGEQVALDGGSQPSQNYQLFFNIAGGYIPYLGTRAGQNPDYFDGCMSHVAHVDGTQELPTIFGSTDSTTGEWKIKTSITPSSGWGTNGYHILVDGNSGTDQSGQSNNWTVGAGTLTKTEDNPSNVFATMNFATSKGNYTLTKGNLVCYGGNQNHWKYAFISNIGASSGKYYWEIRLNTDNGHNITGICRSDKTWTDSTVYSNGGFNGVQSSASAGGLGIYSQTGASMGGALYINGSSTTLTTNDIVMYALDLDNKKMWVGKNGVWANAGSGGGVGNPATGANPLWGSGEFTTGASYLPASQIYYTNAHVYNFGNGYFETTQVSAGTNASGNGIFEYDVPTGYTALSTKGLNL